MNEELTTQSSGLVDSIINSLCKTDSVDELEKAMLQEPQVEVPVLHHFGPGVYIREVRMSAGTFAVGHYQKHSQMNVMLTGKVRIQTEDGEKVLAAPMIYVGPEGRKAGYIEEDVVWLNVFPNPDNETDIDELERRFLIKSENFTSTNLNQVRQADIEDFFGLLQEFNLDASEVRSQSENLEDQMEMPHEYVSRISVRESMIEGLGLYANAPFSQGEIIAPARLGGKRTPAGRYTNHAKEPNCKFVLMGDQDVYLVAKEDIDGCRGGSKGTELTVSYYQALELKGIYRSGRVSQ